SFDGSHRAGDWAGFGVGPAAGLLRSAPAGDGDSRIAASNKAMLLRPGTGYSVDAMRDMEAPATPAARPSPSRACPTAYAA
ncbi:hypothetical protein ABTM44_18545, partial [Acinetobacter baumannii]